MTNLALHSDPQSQIPRHTVAEWFQMDGVCGRKGVTVTSSLLRFRGFSCISAPASASKIREIAVDLDCLVLNPSWPLNRTLYLKMWFPYVMMMPWIGTNLDTVKKHQVVYLRKMVRLYAKGRHYVNAQGRSGGGSLEGLLSKWFLCQVHLQTVNKISFLCSNWYGYTNGINISIRKKNRCDEARTISLHV